MYIKKDCLSSNILINNYPLREYISIIQKKKLYWVPQILKCIQDVSKILQQLHQNLHFHLGLSWDNLFVDSKGKFKLLDFGIGSRITKQAHSWLPPESHLGYPQSEVGDFYAMGIA